MEQNNTSGRDYDLYIDGRYVEPQGSARLPVINPATGETWATISDASAQDVEQAIDAARGCFESTWSRTSPGTRVRLLYRLAESIERRSAELAEIEARDNGKLLREMSAQLKSLPGWYRYYAGLADKIHGETVPLERESVFAYTLREPLGVVACITPWNSPLLLGAWKIAPALAAGNTIVINLMRYEAARLFDAGQPCGAEANLAKLLAADASWEAANVCLQTHGGFGFAAEYDVERKFRETRLYQVAPISTNLILAYLAEHTLGLPRSY